MSFFLLLFLIYVFLLWRQEILNRLCLKMNFVIRLLTFVLINPPCFWLVFFMKSFVFNLLVVLELLILWGWLGWVRINTDMLSLDLGQNMVWEPLFFSLRWLYKPVIFAFNAPKMSFALSVPQIAIYLIEFERSFNQSLGHMLISLLIF